MASPTIGTRSATNKNVPTGGAPSRAPPRVGEENGTGPRRKVQRTVKPVANTPVRAKASPVTSSGSSSQRFTS
jgi:hypothetical protein